MPIILGETMISNTVPFTPSRALLSNFTELVAFGTEAAQQNIAQVQKATALSQTLIPKAAQLHSLDGANQFTLAHFAAMTALSTEQTQANVNAVFDVFRHTYAGLVGFGILPNSIIASAKFERTLSGYQDRTLEMTEQANAAIAQRVAELGAGCRVEAA
jgi:predicted HAD superfamily Cof-like phosphohydrolase